ncbi:hypothetical protein [Yoonia sp.]
MTQINHVLARAAQMCDLLRVHLIKVIGTQDAMTIARPDTLRG